MIRNIVFDMGNVLILFDPERFMDVEGIEDPEDRKLILRELFQSTEWAQMDLGVLTEESAAPIILERIPVRLAEPVNHLLHCWWKGRACIPGMEELDKTLKDSGYRIFLLSNASVSQHRYWPHFPVSRYFDGKLISCDYGIVKPNPEIYRIFIQQFGLEPSECLFIDDLPANVAAAVQCGWTGIVFHGDAEELKKKLTINGIRLNR